MKHFVNGVYENAGPCPGAEGLHDDGEAHGTFIRWRTSPSELGRDFARGRYTQEAFLHGHHPLGSLHPSRPHPNRISAPAGQLTALAPFAFCG